METWTFVRCKEKVGNPIPRGQQTNSAHRAKGRGLEPKMMAKSWLPATPSMHITNQKGSWQGSLFVSTFTYQEIQVAGLINILLYENKITLNLLLSRQKLSFVEFSKLPAKCSFSDSVSFLRRDDKLKVLQLTWHILLSSVSFPWESHL